MNKILPFVLTVILIGICACSYSQSTQEALLGKWQLVNSSGGITGKGFPIKKNAIIEFTADCQYLSFEQDSLEQKSTYYLTKSLSKYRKKDSLNILLIGYGDFKKYELYITKTRLILHEPYADGFTRVYIRELKKK